MLLRLGVLVSPAGCPYSDVSFRPLLPRCPASPAECLASPAECPYSVVSLSSLSRSLSCFSGWVSFLLRLGVLSSPAGCPCFSSWVSLLLRLSVLASPAECPFAVVSLSSLSRSLSCFSGWVSLLSCLSPNSPSRCSTSPAGCPCFPDWWVSLLSRFSPTSPSRCPGSPAGCPCFSG